MGRPRLELQALLETLLGSRQVYFQPPNGTKMLYPAITYEWENQDVRYADNLPHLVTRQYLVTVIDRDPDSAIPDKIAALPYSSFNRAFPADDLNHVVFTLYF